MSARLSYKIHTPNGYRADDTLRTTMQCIFHKSMRKSIRVYCVRVVRTIFHFNLFELNVISCSSLFAFKLCQSVHVFTLQPHFTAHSNSNRRIDGIVSSHRMEGAFIFVYFLLRLRSHIAMCSSKQIERVLESHCFTYMRSSCLFFQRK